MKPLSLPFSIAGRGDHCIASLPAGSHPCFPLYFPRGAPAGARLSLYGEKADPGESVEVSFLGQTHTTKANDDGHWKITLSPMEPGQIWNALTITGRNTLTLEDVVTGEVWLCSGQSNMNSHPSRMQRMLHREIASSSNPQLRMFSVFRRSAA